MSACRLLAIAYEELRRRGVRDRDRHAAIEAAGQTEAWSDAADRAEAGATDAVLTHLVRQAMNERSIGLP